MRSLIVEARQVYEAAGLDCASGLLPPADEAAISALGSDLALPLPDELRALYAVHGGQDEGASGDTGLFGEHRLHSPSEAAELHRVYVDNYLFGLGRAPVFPPGPEDEGDWAPALIPFASYDAYALCIDATAGDVWEFIPAEGLIRHRPSIAAVLREVIAAVRSGGEARLGPRRRGSMWIE